MGKEDFRGAESIFQQGTFSPVRVHTGDTVTWFSPGFHMQTCAAPWDGAPSGTCPYQTTPSRKYSDVHLQGSCNVCTVPNNRADAALKYEDPCFSKEKPVLCTGN